MLHKDLKNIYSMETEQFNTQQTVVYCRLSIFILQYVDNEMGGLMQLHPCLFRL